jgi:hypothetical protein
VQPGIPRRSCSHRWGRAAQLDLVSRVELELGAEPLS